MNCDHNNLELDQVTSGRFICRDCSLPLYKKGGNFCTYKCRPRNGTCDRPASILDGHNQLCKRHAPDISTEQIRASELRAWIEEKRKARELRIIGAGEAEILRAREHAQIMELPPARTEQIFHSGVIVI